MREEWWTVLLPWIVGFSLLGGVCATAVAGLFLLFPDRVRRSLVPHLVSYAAGTLLGAAFLGLLPRALAAAPVSAIMPTALGGVVLFFCLEKLVVWRHCHAERCEVHGAAGPLLLIGDAVHNFVDGVVIAAAFLSSVPLGVAASLAVAAHEVPQEVGDFAILLDSGYARGRAFAYNTLCGAATPLGALLGYLVLGGVRAAVPYLMTLSAASFVYVAAVDLMPGLHRRAGARDALTQVLLLLAGIGTVALFALHHE